MDYTSYVSSMAALLSISPQSTLQNSPLLDRMIEYAELRIYRDLDLIRTQHTVDTDNAMTPGERSIRVPSSILIVERVSLALPAGNESWTGTLVPLERMSLSMLDFIWPAQTQQDRPKYYNIYMHDQEAWILVAPSPDDGYYLQVGGTQRPAPLSEGNQNTILTLYTPDLFLAASAVFGFGGILRNFGAQADDPASALSWENTYQQLKASVDLENLRLKSNSTQWTAYPPTEAAKVTRA